MLIDKYNRLILDKLPAEIKVELTQISNDTDSFKDEELVDIYKDNFNEIFKIVEDKYPEAIKPKLKLVNKIKPKLVKKVKLKIVKKADSPKPKLKIKAKKEESKDVDVFIDKKGKKFVVKSVRTKEPWANELFDTVEEADQFINDNSLNLIESEKHEDTECAEAVATIHKQKKHKAELAKAREERPKKKVSVIAREHIAKGFTAFLKTSLLKTDRKLAEGLAKSITSTFVSYNPKFTEALSKELEASIEKQYVHQMALGGKFDEMFNKAKGHATKAYGQSKDAYDKVKSHATKIHGKAKEVYSDAKKYTVDKIHEQKKNIALDALLETRGTVKDKKDSILLNQAYNLVERHFKRGGIMDIPQEGHVFTKDGVEVKKASNKYRGHVFFDADGLQYKCLGYFPKLGDCVYLNIKTNTEVVGCMDGFYFNDPTKMAHGGKIKCKSCGDYFKPTKEEVSGHEEGLFPLPEACDECFQMHDNLGNEDPDDFSDADTGM